MNIQQLTPLKFRALVRDGTLKGKPTTAACTGYKQANLAIVPKEYAEDFSCFVNGNKGPLPLLYQSKPGEFQAPPLCDDFDIRTDLPLYNKIVNGQVDCQVKDLLEYDLSKYVFFYLGCSFSFNEILLSNKILTKLETKNVSMYESNIKCYESGLFNCNMIISMRAIPQDKLSLTATVTSPLDDIHGAPIHYGNPSVIGIDDINKIYKGDLTEFNDGDVPVFWACGVTGMQALQCAGIDLSFSHAPGHMMVTDVAQDYSGVDPNDKNANCEVISYNTKNQLYSTLSVATLSLLNDLYSIAQKDPGQRSISSLILPEDFIKAALTLSHASSIALITGFPVHTENDTPDKTNRLPGILSLAAALQTLGKQVTLIVDEHAGSLNEKIIKECVDKKLLKTDVKVVPFKKGKTTLKSDSGTSLYDAVVSSGRVGMNKDGKYLTMKGRDLSALVSSIDDFFLEASQCKDVVTISIGDGGNELGMGKVLKKVQNNIPLDEEIACVVGADHLITAGISNWGCYALGLAMYALRSCPIHERYVRKATGYSFSADELMSEFLPSCTREREILGVVESFGFRDGVSPKQVMSVDGMLFDKQHVNVIERMRLVVGLH